MAAGEGHIPRLFHVKQGDRLGAGGRPRPAGQGPMQRSGQPSHAQVLDRVRARQAHLDPARYLRREAKKCTRWTTIEMAHVNVPEVMLPGRVGETLEANLAYLHERR